jgi:hypothetical protein
MNVVTVFADFILILDMLPFYFCLQELPCAPYRTQQTAPQDGCQPPQLAQAAAQRSSKQQGRPRGKAKLRQGRG